MQKVKKGEGGGAGLQSLHFCSRIAGVGGEVPLAWQADMEGNSKTIEARKACTQGKCVRKPY